MGAMDEFINELRELITKIESLRDLIVKAKDDAQNARDLTVAAFSLSDVESVFGRTLSNDLEDAGENLDTALRRIIGYELEIQDFIRRLQGGSGTSGE
jgi:hypothetical protein